MSEMTQAVAASPLAQVTPLSGAISLREQALCGKIALRGELDDAAFVAACEAALGGVPQATLAPPQQLSTGALFWIGPNEWILHCDLGQTEQILATFKEAGAGVHLSAVDVSDYYVLIHLEGELARAVLSRGTPMDMHPKVFVSGNACATRFAKCSVLLHAHSDTSFDLQVRWSHAEYLWQFLAQAASQYD